MNRLMIRYCFWLFVGGFTFAWAQHGHGAAMAGGHGAPPQFSNTPAMSAPKTTSPGAAPGAARNSAPQTTTVFARVSNNPALSTRIQPLLPSGMSLQSAAAGFKNQGQFIAALHVSQNLKIPFSQLKADMTGNHHDSLGQAIQSLRPSLSSQTVKSNVKLARLQSRVDERIADSTAPVGIAARISQNRGLTARITALLPAGTTLQADTTGFRSEGQFIAALHVSRNLNIPFSQLQTEVAGGKTLGQAITDLKPGLTSAIVQADVRLADRQARRDVEFTETAGTL